MKSKGQAKTQVVEVTSVDYKGRLSTTTLYPGDEWTGDFSVTASVNEDKITKKAAVSIRWREQ